MILFSAIKSWLRNSAAISSLLVVFALWSGYSPSLHACDVGCGTGNYSMGMLSQVESDFIGVRYRTLSSDSHLLYAEHLRTQEFFKVTELWGRYSPADRFHITAVLPYLLNSQLADGGEKEQRGIGDVILMGQYTLYTSVSADEETPEGNWKHRLLVGGGVKLPTGRYDEPGEQGTANANFQLGTGSTDILFAGSYTVQFDALSVSAEVNYRINTENSRNYRFGNRLSGTVSLSYVVPVSDELVLAPDIGVYGEWSALDVKKSISVQETGGTLLAATAGVDFYIAQTAVLGAKLYIPVEQELAGGQIQTHNRVSVQCAWLW